MQIRNPILLLLLLKILNLITISNTNAQIGYEHKDDDIRQDKFDHTLQNNICPPGYTGSTCSLLKFAPKANELASYREGALGNNFTTWGASIVRGANYYFMLAETFPNNIGVECWGKTSTCAILKSHSVLGSWDLVAFFGFNNLANQKSKDVPYCHDMHLMNVADLQHNIVVCSCVLMQSKIK